MYEITQLNKTVIPCFVLPLICCRLFSLLSFYHILFMTEKYAKGPGTRKFQSTFSLFRNRKRYPSVAKGAKAHSSGKLKFSAKAHSFGELKLPSSQTTLIRVVVANIARQQWCRLNFLFDFWVLRDSLSYPLASNRVTSGQTVLALFPKIK